MANCVEGSLTNERCFELLTSDSVDERRFGARQLKLKVREIDHPKVLYALSLETDPWVRGALKDVLRNLETPAEPHDFSDLSEEKSDIDDIDQSIVDRIRSAAREESIGQILHELEPIAGALELFATELVDDFEGTQLHGEVHRLFRLLDTFEAWRKIENPPNLRQFNVSTAMQNLISSHKKIYPTIDFFLRMSDDIIVESDQCLIEIVITNAIRNGCESIMKCSGLHDGKVVVSAGLTDKDFWVSIIDNGLGLPVGKRFLAHEFTTKPGHQGRGLSTVQQALKVLGGEWSIENRPEGGVTFHFNIAQKRNG